MNTKIAIVAMAVLSGAANIRKRRTPTEAKKSEGTGTAAGFSAANPAHLV